MRGDRLGDLLEEASRGIPDLDFAERAWASARRTQQRKRRMLGVGAVALLAAGVVVAASAGADNSPPPPRAAASSPTPSARAWLPVRAVATDGTPVVVGPHADQIPALPRDQTVLPRNIGWTGGPPGLVASADAVVRLAALREVTPNVWSPVLMLTHGKTPPSYAIVQVALVPLGTEFGSTIPPLSDRSVSPDGRTVALVQPEGVVLVNARTAKVQRLAPPNDPNTNGHVLESGGYAPNGRFFVHSALATWSIDVHTAVWTRLSRGAFEASSRIGLVSGQPGIQTYDTTGELAVSVPISLPMSTQWAGSWSSDRWVATGAFVSASMLPPGLESAFNGLMVASLPDGEDRRALVFDGLDDGGIKGAVRAIGWVGERALFQYSTARASWILSFGATTGGLRLVSTIARSAISTGFSGQVIALGPLDDPGR